MWNQPSRNASINKTIEKGGIFISEIEITMSYDTPHDFFRQLILKYPDGVYKKPSGEDSLRGSNWFVLTIDSEAFEKQYTGVMDITPEVKLTWFARELDVHLMDDYHSDPSNYTP
tara:strand:+ start:298 stop:642 length:345 start_codon:yes stop_codon:yes gene_type:complete